MDEQSINREVEKTLTSLDRVERFGAPPGFPNRIAELVRASEQGPGWLPNLALAMVVLIALLDGAALSWSWQTQNKEVSKQTMLEVTRNSLWVDTPGLFQDQR